LFVCCLVEAKQIEGIRKKFNAGACECGYDVTDHEKEFLLEFVLTLLDYAIIQLKKSQIILLSCQ